MHLLVNVVRASYKRHFIKRNHMQWHLKIDCIIAIERKYDSRVFWIGNFFFFPQPLTHFHHRLESVKFLNMEYQLLKKVNVTFFKLLNIDHFMLHLVQ